MSDPERAAGDAQSMDLSSQIADRVRQGRAGALPAGSRHRATKAPAPEAPAPETPETPETPERPAPDAPRARRRGRAAPRGRASQASKASHASQGRMRPVLRLGLLLLITAAGVALLRAFVLASFYIPSESMEPTLHGCSRCQPDRVMVDKLSYRFSRINRGDVIVFTRPPALPVPDEDLIKRVVGLPGETVSGHDGGVYIDNQRLIEPYINPACRGTADFAPVRVPAGRYFVMGDNRCNSSDSRYFGTISRGSVIGRAFAVVWPLKHLKTL